MNKERAAIDGKNENLSVKIIENDGFSPNFATTRSIAAINKIPPPYPQISNKYLLLLMKEKNLSSFFKKAPME